MIPRDWTGGGLRAEIREGRPADADALRSHYRAVAAGAAPWFPIPRDPEGVDRWLRRTGFLDFERSLHWVAATDGGVAAHLVLTRQDVPTIGLEGIATPYLTVADAYRGAGLGAAMFALWGTEVEERLREAGVRRVVAHVFPENAPSRRLAASVGLRPEGVLRQHMRGGDGYFHDMLVLAKLLSEDERCPACRQRDSQTQVPRAEEVFA